MKKAKKILALLLCAVLLVCATVAGTLAFLEAETETVTNTFVAAGGDGPFIDKKNDGTYKFELKEYDVDVTTAGKYSLKEKTVENEVTAITYDKVMPGTTLPKQAFVKLSRSATETTITDGVTTSTKEIAPAPAYLYLEVCGTSPSVKVIENEVETEVVVYTWEIDDTNWVELKDAEDKAVVGPNGGKMYLYKLSDNTHVVTNIAAYDDADNYINIIKDEEVNVADVELPAGEFQLKFNAFLAQASTGETDDPAAVFTACFK